MTVSKKHLRHYFILYFILLSMYLLVSVGLAFLLKTLLPLFTLLTFIIGFLLYIPVRLLFMWFTYRNFFEILSHEHNSQKFYDTIHHRPLRPSLLYRLYAEWYVGNYEKLITLSLSGYNTSKNLQKKCTYLTFLAIAYFELHDIDKLKQTTDIFFELKNTNPTKEKLFSNFKIFSFYKAFINSDYTECLDYIDNQQKHLNLKHPADKLNLLKYKSYCAICLFWQGDKPKAKELFEYFKQNTPNLINFNELATKYLFAIEHDDPSLIGTTKYDIDTSDLEQQLLSFRKKEKKKRIIINCIIISIVALMTALDIVEYINDVSYRESIIEYEKDLNSAISKYYDNAKFIKYFDVRNGEQYIDALCLIESQGGFDLASVVTYDKGESSDLVFLIEDIQIPHNYSVKSAVSDNMITLFISDEQISGSDYKDIIEFSYNNTNYWIGIKDITPLT